MMMTSWKMWHRSKDLRIGTVNIWLGSSVLHINQQLLQQFQRQLEQFQRQLDQLQRQLDQLQRQIQGRAGRAEPTNTTFTWDHTQLRECSQRWWFGRPSTSTAWRDQLFCDATDDGIPSLWVIPQLHGNLWTNYADHYFLWWLPWIALISQRSPWEQQAYYSQQLFRRWGARSSRWRFPHLCQLIRK